MSNNAMERTGRNLPLIFTVRQIKGEAYPEPDILLMRKGKKVSRRTMLQDLCCSHSIPVVRSGLVSHWLRLHNLRDYAFSDICIPNAAFAPSNDIPEQLYNDMESLFPYLSLKNLETALETLLEYKLRRHTGTVLTPEFIINYLLTTSQTIRQAESNQPPTICDPACGYAGFLLPALRFLSAHFSMSPIEAVRRYVYGFDINPESVDIAKIMLQLYLLECGYDPKDVVLNIHCDDSLLESAQDIKCRAGNASGFDILVTNPPYIKLQNLSPDYREHLLLNYPEFSTGSFSTAMLFLVAGYRLLSSSGCLGYITQNNLFTSLAGVEVRRFLSSAECIKRIVSFGHAKVFENASAYTCLIFVSPRRTQAFEYGRLFRNVNSTSLNAVKMSRIAHSTLNPSKWRLVTEEHTHNIKRLETQGTPLGTLCTLRVGFATLKDKVYFVRGDNSSVTGEGPDGSLMDIEPEITRPAIKIAEFDHETDLIGNCRRIIFPYERSNGKYRALTEDVLLKKFPHCYKYLQLWRQHLGTRDKGLRKIEPWYAWGRTQCMDAPAPKLLTKTFSDHPNFLYDSTESLFCNGYAVFPKTPESSLFEPRYPLRVVQAILDSAIMDYYLRLTSFQIEGDYQCYQKNFIERFAIPVFSEKEQEMVLNLTGAERDRFLCAKYELDHEAVAKLLVESEEEL